MYLYNLSISTELINERAFIYKLFGFSLRKNLDSVRNLETYLTQEKSRKTYQIRELHGWYERLRNYVKCWETKCNNTLQFLFQIFTLFSPISNILRTCNLNYTVFYVTPNLFTFFYQHILRKLCHVLTNAEHEAIILCELGKW